MLVETLQARAHQANDDNQNEKSGEERTAEHGQCEGSAQRRGSFCGARCCNGQMRRCDVDINEKRETEKKQKAAGDVRVEEMVEEEDSRHEAIACCT